MLPSRKGRSCTGLGMERGGVAGKEKRFLFKGEAREQKSKDVIGSFEKTSEPSIRYTKEGDLLCIA